MTVRELIKELSKYESSLDEEVLDGTAEKITSVEWSHGKVFITTRKACRSKRY